MTSSNTFVWIHKSKPYHSFNDHEICGRMVRLGGGDEMKRALWIIHLRAHENNVIKISYVVEI